MSHRSDLIAKDIEKYLKNHENKELLRFITCGSVDDGKSTLIGRMLHDSKLIYEDQLNAIKKNKSGENHSADGAIDLAAIVDGLQAEREQGITIDVAYRFFSTEQKKFIIADTPGHEQYTRNMVTGASNADLALILIDAENGVLAQTKRHSYIVNLLGIQQLIVSINKMDAVNYKQSVFESIKEDYLGFAEKVGIDEHKLEFVPISALKGDNVVDESSRLSWYAGNSLIWYLENAKVREGRNYKQFRMPIQYVLRPDASFRGYSGTITSGSLSKGDEVMVLPSRKKSHVSSIITYDAELDEAEVPAAVTLTLNDEIDISRGDMLIKVDDIPLVSDRFDAMIVWMSEEELRPGTTYFIKRASTLVTGHVEEIYYKVDMQTLAHQPADSLQLNEISFVRLNISAPLAFDKYDSLPATGSFIFIDRITNNTVGAGMIKELQESRNVIWHKQTVTQASRSVIKGQQPAVIWLTGLSSSGKSTIANALEVKLNNLGYHTFLLDGDNIRHRLNQDLDFSAKGRHENIRRIGEVSSLFVDAGLIVITSFISPYRSDRAMVRKMVSAGKFIEVYIDTPIEICEQRDPKGLYSRARSGEIKNFTGIDSVYEVPETPGLKIETEKISIQDAVKLIYNHLLDCKIL